MPGGARLADLARLREAAYRLLAVLLQYPREETLAVAPEAARHLRRHSRLAAALAFYGPLDGLLRQVVSLTPARLGALQASYGRLFIPGADRGAIPLCESAYVDPQVMPPGVMLAQVERAYAAAGLAPAPEGEAPDHACVELEFSSFLCGQEAEAWEAGRLPVALEAMGRQGKFLEQHLCRWLPSLASAVAAQEASSLYARVAQTAWAMVSHDSDFQEALATRLATDAVAR